MTDINEKVMDLKSDLFIDDSSYHKLNKEFKSHSSRHMEWILLAAQATRKVNELRIKLKIISAEIAEEYRNKHFEDTGKTLAVSFDIKSNVLPLDPRWKEVNKRLIEAQEEADIATGAVDSFSERGYLLKLVAEYNQSTNSPTLRFKSPENKIMDDLEDIPA
jgi:hypothetical protein